MPERMHKPGWAQFPGTVAILAQLALPLWPAATVLPVSLLGFTTAAEAQSRSSGGYSRPRSSAGSRTPSFGGSGGYSRPRTPSSGGYSLPQSSSRRPSIPYGGRSAGDQSYSRSQSGDALRRMRESQAAAERAARPPVQAAPNQGTSGRGGGFGFPGGGSYSGGGYSGGGGYAGGYRGAPTGVNGGWYRDRGWQVPGAVLNGPRSFGIWDAAFLWFMFSTLNRPGHADFFRNHQDDPGYREWRQQAEQRARDDAETRTRLDELDRQIAAGAGQPRNPDYLPPDVPAEIATGTTPAAQPDRRTPSAAPEGEGGIPAAVPVVILLGGGALAVLAWRRRRASAGTTTARGTTMSGGTIGSAAGMLRHKASGEGYAPSRFRLGMTLTLDPTPFLLATGASHLQPPAQAGQMVSVTELGRIGGDGPGGLVRLYLPEDRAMLQLHLGAGNEPDECRYFAILDEVTPADEAEWGVWLDPAEGLIGWPEFQTKDGKVYARAWSPGQERVAPRPLQEVVESPAGQRTVSSQAMLYAAPTGLAAPAPQTEYILVSAIEDGGQAWIEIRAGLDVNPASLSLA